MSPTHSHQLLQNPKHPLKHVATASPKPPPNVPKTSQQPLKRVPLFVAQQPYCFMYISVVGLGVTAAEKFGKK